MACELWTPVLDMGEQACRVISGVQTTSLSCHEEHGVPKPSFLVKLDIAPTKQPIPKCDLHGGQRKESMGRIHTLMIHSLENRSIFPAQRVTLIWLRLSVGVAIFTV